MKTNQIIISVVIAVLAFGLGYSVKGNQNLSMGNHAMPNGNMMGDNMMNGSNMEDMMDGMMMGLQGKTGDDFDKAFLSEMVMHHQGAVVMAEAVLKTSKRAELVELANNIISAQNKEIKMMKDWQKKWFNQ